MRLAFIAILPLALAACGMADASEKESAGPRMNRDFAFSGFERVKLAGSDDVKIIEGASFAVRADGPQDILDQLDIKLEDGTLIIGRKRSSWGWSASRGHAVVTVTMPALRAASVAGSGNLRAEATATDRFQGSVAGSGDLSIDAVRADETVFSLAGSGDIAARGKTRSAKYSLAGSGDIAASDLLAEELDISLAGSGDVAAHATGSAKVSLVGSGDVEIKGTTNCSSKKVGSGEIRCG